LKALGFAAAAAIAFAPLSVLAIAPGVTEAAPCAGVGANPRSCRHCLHHVDRHHTANVCDEAVESRPAQVAPGRAPVPAPEAPALPSMAPVQTPEVVPPSPVPPSPIPVQTPKISQGPGAATDAPLVTPPKGLDAPPQAVAAAKAAPATRVNPATLPKPPTQVDFNQQVQSVVKAHSGNIDVVKVDDQELVRPRHWDYIDYDAYRRPMLYNPLTQAMTFRYFYNGADREAYVPAGGRIVLDVATVGLFPFTAVGDSYVAAGSFSGGAWIPPDGWNGPPPPGYTAPPPPEVSPRTRPWQSANCSRWAMTVANPRAAKTPSCSTTPPWPGVRSTIPAAAPRSR
jgi:hypothetical protein